MTTRRAPVLRPRATSGRGLLVARGRRVLVDGSGALVTHGPGGEVERLAGPGEVTRALLLDHELAAARLGREGSYAGALVLLAGERPVLSLRLSDWGPPARLGSASRRTTAGLVALVAGLGLPLEPADPACETLFAEVHARPRTTEGVSGSHFCESSLSLSPRPC